MKGWKRNGIFVTLLAVAFFLHSASAQQDKNAKGSKGGEGKKAEAAAAKGDAANGGKLFEEKCALCHEATSEETKVGPGLKGLFKKAPHKNTEGKEHAHTVSMVREQILKGSGTMPPWEGALSEKELDDIIAYLQTL